MDLELTGRSAVVTGGSKGIGLAVTRRLAAEGMHVLVAARRDTDELRELRDRADVHLTCVDLATASGAAELVTTAGHTFERLDLVVNNVGASEPAADTLAHDDAQWQRVFDVTFFSAVRVLRAAAPLLTDGTGAVVNIASLNARLPSGVIAPYSAAKAALLNVSKSLAEDLAPRGVRVNSISSGPVRTPMWTAPGGFAELFAAQAGVTPQEVMDRVLPESMAISLGRVAEPDEIADVVAFLASPRAGYVTGADYVVDGGMLKSIA